MAGEFLFGADGRCFTRPRAGAVPLRAGAVPLEMSAARAIRRSGGLRPVAATMPLGGIIEGSGGSVFAALSVSFAVFYARQG
jgi:hypothetical protein